MRLTEIIYGRSLKFHCKQVMRTLQSSQILYFSKLRGMKWNWIMGYGTSYSWIIGLDRSQTGSNDTLFQCYVCSVAEMKWVNRCIFAFWGGMPQPQKSLNPTSLPCVSWAFPQDEEPVREMPFVSDCLLTGSEWTVYQEYHLEAHIQF